MIARAVLLSIACLAGVAAAGKPAAFRAPYERGLKRYDAGDYAAALVAFQRAYELRPLPALLFNIAQAHRKLGHALDAIAAYERYLADEKDVTPENRARVEGHLARLRASLAPPPAPPIVAVEAPPPIVEAPPPVPPPIVEAPPPAPPVERVSLPVAPAPAPPAKAPLHRRPWLWATVGGVLVAGGLAAGVAVAVTPDPTRDIQPDNRFSVSF